jgi:hypothetical protein
MAHGEVARRRVRYQAGFFRRDGDNARTTQTHGGEDALAGRVLFVPFAPRDDSPLEELEVGVALASSQLEQGLGLRGRTVFGEGVFFDRVFVNGRRLRRGVEAGWAYGPVSVSGEYMAVTDAREGMGLQGESLPGVRATGCYVAGTWTLTGERKQGRVEPTRGPCVQTDGRTDGRGSSGGARGVEDCVSGLTTGDYRRQHAKLAGSPFIRRPVDRPHATRRPRGVADSSGPRPCSGGRPDPFTPAVSSRHRAVVDAGAEDTCVEHESGWRQG